MLVAVPGPAIAMDAAGPLIGALPELGCTTGRITTSASAKKNNLIFNGGSSLRELSAILGSLVSCSSQRAMDGTGRALLSIARQAWLSRQIELLDEVVLAILALPLDPSAHAAARYYQAFALRKSTDIQRTQRILEDLTDRVSSEYRPRLLLAVGSCALTSRDLEDSGKVYLEAAQSASWTDPLSKCQALRMLALIRSCDGDHAGSLADLERLFPVMRSLATSYPDDYRYYLNNLAYELGQVGRIDEAKAAINVALGSPNAHRFPDWAETARELETMPRRVFLPLIFALGTPAAVPSPPATSDMVAAVVSAPEQTPREEVQVQAVALARPESQPEIQISVARRVSRGLKRNPDRILLVLAWAHCRRLAPARSERQSLKPTFEARGWGKSPPARAPPITKTSLR